ncbi:MAG: glycosyltransferase family 2 protein [Melioribacteraceae bacterium]|nr:MAG: glycosyltransferase family 2 protein [Melioribacteraceae bacterium]
MYRVCAIVLNYNGFEDTIVCVNSLLKATYKYLDIVIVDNGSNNNSVEKLSQKFPKLEIIVAKKNLGYAGGMNLGIRFALQKNYDFVLILNNDTEVTNNFLEPMLKVFEENSNIGIASPKVGLFDRREIIYCAGAEINFFLCGGIAQYKGKNMHAYANENRFISMAEGCCLLVKKEVFEEVGLFDEKFFLYFEEVEFSERVIEKFKIVYVHNSIIYHKSGGGLGWSNYSPLYYYYYTRNRFIFFKDKSILIKLYVFIFALLNTIGKWLVIKFKYSSTEKNMKRVKEAQKSLLSGFSEGLKNFF